MKKCLCGCGEEVKEWNKWVKGHHWIGKKHSEKTKKKISKANKGKQHFLGHKHSEESRKKMSKGHKGKKLSEETKKRMSEGKRGHKGVVHTTKTKQKISEANKGRKLTEETKKRIGEASKGRIVSKETRKRIGKGNKGNVPSPKCGYGKGQYYQSPYQDRIYLRSSYEIKYAEFLDRNNIDWLYEPYTFDLGDTTYLPDFYLIKYNVFIEIKGWMKPESQNKIDFFRKYYSNEKLDVLFKEDLIFLGVL